MQKPVFIFILLLNLGLYAQNDSVMYSPDVRMEDGIYPAYADFRRNISIKKQQIISKQDKEQLEFLSKALSEDTLYYAYNGSVIKVISEYVWGYIQNNVLYVNYKGMFYRVPVFGSLSYLVAKVQVYNPGFYDPRFGMTTGGGTTQEIREFLMNFYDGYIIPFTQKTVEEFISRDTALFEEYKKLSRRRQKEQLYAFIRKYNTKHPVYFLK